MSKSRRIKHEGRRYGNWKIISYIGYKLGHGGSLYYAECLSCHCQYRVAIGNVIRGRSRQCHKCRDATGAGRYKHGMSDTPEYRVYSQLKHTYSDLLCKLWLASFENFYADMGKRPTDATTLVRRDPTKPYSPSNCFWGTWNDFVQRRINDASIRDDLYKQPMSRQMRYQIRKYRQGLCVLCGKNRRAENASMCRSCAKKRGVRRLGKNKPRESSLFWKYASQTQKHT